MTTTPIYGGGRHKTFDAEYVICPYCGEQHGDCWEWVTDDIRDCECQNEKCQKTFKCYAEWEVTYIGIPMENPDVATKDFTPDSPST